MSGMNPNRAVKNALALASIYVTDGTAQAGAAVDCKGYQRLAAVVAFGNVTAAAAETVTVKLQAGDASNGSDAADITGATTTAIVVSNTIDNTIQAIIEVDLAKVGKRYVRAVMTLSAVTTLMFCCVVFELGGRGTTILSTEYSQFISV